MFPLGDENPTRNTPLVTLAVIAINVAVFVMFNLQMNDAELQRWTLEWGFDVDRPFSPQLVTSMFMHGGLAHIFGNLWVLWIVGNNVEDKLGRGRFLVLYVLGGIAAALAYTLISQFTDNQLPPEIQAQLGDRKPPLVGASGAIAAVMGIYLVFFPEARIRLLFWWWIVPVRAKWFIGMTLLLDLFTSIAAKSASAGGVATMAHVGGGLFGVAAAVLLKPAVGGGGEGDAWDVHTGFAKRLRPGSDTWGEREGPRPVRPSFAPRMTDEAAMADLERSITELVRAGRLREAIDVYPAYVALAREQPLPDDVQIEIAHELYRQWLPKEAIPAYLRYLETHPRGEDAPEAKFRLGVLFARGLGRRGEAARWLREAAAEHADPQIVAAARQLLAQLG